MAFPTTPILDDFTGADENPITTNWTTKLYPTDSNIRRLSNQVLATVDGDFNTAWYDLASFGPDCEGWLTMVTKPPDSFSIRIHARVQAEGTTGFDGYAVKFQAIAGAGSDLVRLERMTNAVETVLGADIIQEFSDGDKLGISCIGDQISAWRYSGGSWAILGTRTDSTYSSPGRLAIESNHTSTALDDFGGGTYVSPATFRFDTSQFPKPKLRSDVPVRW